MKKVVLVFPDTVQLSDFIINQGVCNAEVNSREQTLTAILDGDDIIKAIDDYGGHVMEKWPITTPSF